MNYVKISATGTSHSKEFYVGLAKYLAEHKIYFDFSAVFSKEEPLGFDKETMVAMQEVAGEYYHAHSLSECGTKRTCSARGYGPFYGAPNPSVDLTDALNNFNEYVNSQAVQARRGTDIKVYGTDPTMRLSCSIHQNVDYPTLELVCGNPEMMIPLTRATARAMKSDFWMTYVAHEWYADTKTFDPLKTLGRRDTAGEK